MVQDALFYPICISKCIEVLICGSALYCYFKIKILKKPPGNLVLIQLFLFFIADIVQVCFLLKTDINPNQDEDYSIIDEIISSFLYLAFWLGYLYESCLNFELYIRIKNSPMGQNYKKRQIFYHCISITVALISSIVAFPLAGYSHRYTIRLFGGVIELYILSPIHFIITAKLVLEAIFIICSIYFYRKIRNPVKANKFKYNIIYLCIFWLLVLFNIIASIQMSGNTGKEISKTSITLIMLCTFLKIGLFVVRLSEPGLRIYIKDRFRNVKNKIKYLFISRSRSSLVDLRILDDIQSTSPNYTVLIDELKQESIEYQLIAISILVLNNYTNYLNIRDSKQYTASDSSHIQERIRYHELEMLSDSYLSQKYSDYYCEYKLYDYYAFRQITSYIGVEANGIANSFSVRENLEGIHKYISEEGSELMLNFVTYDKKCIVKSIKKREQRLFLKEKLSAYYERVMDESLLQHIYGIFKLSIKGKIYRLMIVENNPIIFLYRSFISIHSETLDQDDRITASFIDDQFILDEEERIRFDRVLNLDIGYLRTSQMQSCRIFIDIFEDPPRDKHKHLYSGIYQDQRGYLCLSISDVSYSSKQSKYNDIFKSSIELSVTFNNLHGIESRIRKYIQ